MKKKTVKGITLFLCIISISFAFSACDLDSGSIAKIGSTDGPTSIIENESGNIYKRSEKELVKAVRLNGTLYYETGEDIDAGLNRGDIDGKFEKAVEPFEIPTNDGESNFTNIAGFRLGKTNDIIYVLDEDEWEVFKKVDLSLDDIEKYKYILKIETEEKHTDKDSEFIVLSNEMDIDANDLYASDKNEKLEFYVVSSRNH